MLQLLKKSRRACRTRHYLKATTGKKTLPALLKVAGNAGLLERKAKELARAIHKPFSANRRQVLIFQEFLIHSFFHFPRADTQIDSAYFSFHV